MNNLNLYCPIAPLLITQGFGRNDGYDYTKMCVNGQCLKGHNGIDMVRGWLNGKLYETEGCYVRAAHDGIVTFAGLDGSGGWGVVIRTNEPMLYNGVLSHFKTIYWHLKPSIPVKAGRQVRCGDVVGYADTTGLATAPHLHFGLKPITQGEQDWEWMNIEQNNGYFGAIDPLPLLRQTNDYAYNQWAKRHWLPKIWYQKPFSVL